MFDLVALQPKELLTVQHIQDASCKACKLLDIQRLSSVLFALPMYSPTLPHQLQMGRLGEDDNSVVLQNIPCKLPR